VNQWQRKHPREKVVCRNVAATPISPHAFLDQQEPYLHTILGFVGLKNLQFVYPENQSLGAEAAEKGVKAGIDAVLVLA
jgi:FMN-dependent NADH-azoreductase